MSFVIAPIVEGHGDVDAVPALIRRFGVAARVATPVRCARGKITKKVDVERYARIARANIQHEGGILVVFDADDACAVKLAEEVQSILLECGLGVPVAVAVAVRAFENWLLAGDPHFEFEHADVVQGCKAKLVSRHGRYKETADQKRLLTEMDFELAQKRSRSLRHLATAVAGLVSALPPE